MNETEKIDIELYDLAGLIEKDYLSQINPTNSTLQKKQFFDLIKKHSYLNPNFEYKKQNEELFKQIEEKIQLIQKQLSNSIADKFLKSKSEELLLDVHLMQTVNTPKFCNASKKAYGEPNSKLIKRSLEILQAKIGNIQETPISPIEAK